MGKEELKIEDRPIPEIDENEILVKVGSCCICGSDLSAYKTGGMYGLGIVIGHEFSGMVAGVGKNVNNIETGQRVCIQPFRDLIGLFVDGGFAEYCKVGAAALNNNVFLLPDSVSDEAGALIETLAVGLHAVNRSGVVPEDKTVVFGAGPIGLCTLIGLKAKGVEDVVVADLSELRLAKAKELGADAVFNPNDGAIEEFLKERHGASMYGAQTSVVFECAAAPQTLNDAITSLDARGKIIIVGSYKEPVTIDFLTLQYKELDLISVMAYQDEFNEAIDLVVSGKANVEAMISHRYSLDDIVEAFETQADAARAVKVMIKL